MDEDTTALAAAISGDTDATRLEGLRELTRATLTQVIGGARDVALVDVPTHENVGDNMIWVGEDVYLRDLGRRIRYEADLFRMDDDLLKRRVPDGPILLHGGGNFGDVWPLFQDFRESVVQRFPERKIVQLPQTVYFGSAARAAQANRILGAHPDFTLLVRDSISFSRASRQLPDVRVIFCPDMALGWSPGHAAIERQPRMVVLARGDRESAGDLAGELRGLLTERDYVKDWRLSGLSKVLWLVSRAPGRLSRSAAWLRRNALMYRIVFTANRFNRWQNLRAGFRAFSGADMVVTDRLHAHVLASLLGIANIVTDNNYGKVSAIYEDYTHLFSKATFVESVPLVAAAVGKIRSGGASEAPAA